ncbi:MAG: DUF378 domain-containing protein [Candidatus Hydrogenedentota bacterium]|nr:MAG: DUF378 domain-containing protein [Candidatus Hydrogenedentota bacterium]
MKSIDVISFGLLLVGGLNWGLVGLLSFDLVAMIFGSMSVLSRIVYMLVGFAAIYELAQFKVIRERWTHAEAH